MGRPAGAAVCNTRLRSAGVPLEAIVRRSEGCCYIYIYMHLQIYTHTYIHIHIHVHSLELAGSCWGGLEGD